MHTRDASLRELMDAPSLDDAVLRRTLRDIRHINAILGWRAFAAREVARHVRACGLASFSLLDVACGSADIPLAIARWARHAGIEARIVATDVHPQTLAVAREHTAAEPAIRVERQNALALPYADGSFDLALCTLALHHFAPDDAVRVLKELARVGRHVLVFDVARARLAYVGVLLLTRLAFMGSMTRYDAPVSVRRAYSASELRALAARAGLPQAQVRVAIPYRLALATPGRAGAGEQAP
jgi:SAM-dependent methyltransferase